jgi:hypothetical protein
MLALLGEANFEESIVGAPQYNAVVYYENGSARYSDSRIIIPVASTDTPAQFSAKLLAAIDAEAVRIGLQAPTAIYGNSIAKFR